MTPRRRGRFLAELQAAGISGAALISQRPASFVGGGQPPAARLQHVLDWCAPGTDLYPLFWIDPLEPDALDQVALAVARGIAGFKVICNHFPPGHPAALRTFRAIAEAGRPILFHSGILWDGKPSSEFCRPAGFEALLDVPGLRFTLAHIGWPWCDELIAVYGKFLNALGRNRSTRRDVRGHHARHTADLPPARPDRPLHRRLRCGRQRDLRQRLLRARLQCPGAQEWLRRDEEILTSLGLGQDVLDKVQGGNLRRFLGLSERG